MPHLSQSKVSLAALMLLPKTLVLYPPLNDGSSNNESDEKAADRQGQGPNFRHKDDRSCDHEE
jgi:hypothetical protein